MSKKQIGICALWVLLLAAGHFFSGNVMRYFPEFIMPSFAGGIFAKDGFDMKTYEIRVKTADSSFSLNYHEFLSIYPGMNPINIYKNVISTIPKLPKEKRDNYIRALLKPKTEQPIELFEIVEISELYQFRNCQAALKNRNEQLIFRDEIF